MHYNKNTLFLHNISWAVSGLMDRIDPGSNILVFLRDLCKNVIFYCYMGGGVWPPR